MVEAVYHEEGRAFNTGSGYRYEYVLRDHLGNTRLVFTDKDGSGSIDNSEILSESHYYPFGRKMDGAWYSDTTFSRYKYLYNGKELQEEFDLNFYDYGARWYDPGLGSWWQIDPLAEVSRRWSPYVFSNNNPLRFIDTDGMLPGDSYDQWTQAKNAEAAAADKQGLDAYSALGGGANNAGDPPGKGKNTTPTSTKAASAGIASTAISLGRSAGTTLLGRILAALGSGIGLVATLPFILEGDTQKENENPYTVIYRNVSESEYALIMKTRKFFPNPDVTQGGYQDGKLFWLTPNGLQNWENTSDLAGPYSVYIKVPLSIIGPKNIVQPWGVLMDGHVAGIVNNSSLAAFNKRMEIIFTMKVK